MNHIMQAVKLECEKEYDEILKKLKDNIKIIYDFEDILIIDEFFKWNE